ncbi:MAG: ribose 5-phosphate isomerase [Chitinophagaceae bacterium]|nr:ribose 5-phosphate isomerase [Chitinophagaceae bacterium]
MSLHFDFSKPIALGCDHAGFEYKQAIFTWLQQKGYTVKDFGTTSPDSVDYPDFAHAVASAVENKEYSCGVLLCGSANGVAITANKHQTIRAAICWQNDIATLARKHTDANIICIPARFVSLHLSQEMIEIFLSTEFEGGRHANRVNKIACS